MPLPVARLLVLGAVRMHQPAHGYAIHRELAGWRIETWTTVKPGSIYHALKQLSREGLLREVGAETSSVGPQRTVYELTAAGEAAFRSLVEAALSSFALDELSAGVAFMQALSRDAALHLLREQQRAARSIAEGLQDLVPRSPPRGEPPHMKDLLELWSGNVAATAQWTERLISRLEAGEYVMADVHGRGGMEKKVIEPRRTD